MYEYKHSQPPPPPQYHIIVNNTSMTSIASSCDDDDDEVAAARSSSNPVMNIQDPPAAAAAPVLAPVRRQHHQHPHPQPRHTPSPRMQTLYAESSELLRRALESVDSSSQRGVVGSGGSGGSGGGADDDDENDDDDDSTFDLLQNDTMSFDSSSSITAMAAAAAAAEEITPSTTSRILHNNAEVDADADDENHTLQILSSTRTSTRTTDIMTEDPRAVATTTTTTTMRDDTNITHTSTILQQQQQPVSSASCLWHYWNRSIQATYPFILLCMVLVLWPAGWFALKRLLTQTDSTFHTPIAGSPSHAAQDAFCRKFPNASTVVGGGGGSPNSPTLLVVLQLKNCSNSSSSSNTTSLVDHVYARESSLGLESFLNAKVFGEGDEEAAVTNQHDYYHSTSRRRILANNHNNHNNTATHRIQVSSFYGFQQANLSLLAHSFLSKDERTTFLQVTLLPQPALSAAMTTPSSSSSSSSLGSNNNNNNNNKVDEEVEESSSQSSRRNLQALMEALDEYYYQNGREEDLRSSMGRRLFSTTTTTTSTSTSTSPIMFQNTRLSSSPPTPPPPPPPHDDDDDNLEIGFTGLKYFSRDLRTSTQQDLKRMDTWVLPLALVLVGLTLLLQQPTTPTTTTTRSSSSTATTTTTRQRLLQQQVFHFVRFLSLLLLLPLCGMLSTVAMWSLWMDSVVVSRMQITQFTPSIMMSLTLAMGLDYTLFLMARYLESKSKASSASASASASSNDLTSVSSSFDAIQTMLEQGGQVVVVSGTTLLCTFLALVALPLPMLQSVGVGAAVAIASAMFMNLWIIPALLYTPLLRNGLTTRTPSTGSQRNDQDGGETNEPPILNEDEDDGAITEPLLPPSSLRRSDNPPPDFLPHPSLEHQVEEEEALMLSPAEASASSSAGRGDASLWIRLARQVLHPYKSIIIVLILLQFLLFPVAWNARRLDSSDLSFESLLPEDAPSLYTYHRLVDGGHFGPGKLAPFRILLDGTKSNTTMDSAAAFDLQHDLVRLLLSSSSSSSSSANSKYSSDAVGAKFVGISVADNRPIPYPIYLASKTCESAPSTCANNDALRCLHFLDGQMVSQDRYATYMAVELESISPFDHDAIAWLDETRQRLDDWMEARRALAGQPEVDVYMDGTVAVAHDAVQAVYHSFPKVIGSTLIVVFLLLGFVFRSIIPPLRSVVSISFTLAVSFGLAVLVYQDGILNGRHIRSLTAVDDSGELSWLVPIMSFSIIVGLALDYDVFLVTRISEYRWNEGYGHESSIAAGLESTGGIITSAGIIMALSFGSLLGSQSPALDQWAFLVTTAVLLDTFIVRTILVPAMMGWTGAEYSWWPRRRRRRLPSAESSSSSSSPSSTIILRRLPGFDNDTTTNMVPGVP